MVIFREFPYNKALFGLVIKWPLYEVGETIGKRLHNPNDSRIWQIEDTPGSERGFNDDDDGSGCGILEFPKQFKIFRTVIDA